MTKVKYKKGQFRTGQGMMVQDRTGQSLYYFILHLILKRRLSTTHCSFLSTHTSPHTTHSSLHTPHTPHTAHHTLLTLVHLHSFTALCVPIIRYPSFVSALLCSLVTISLPPSPTLSPPLRARASDASFCAFLFFCSFFIAAPISSRSSRSSE